FFFSSRRRHTRCYRDWSSDVCSSDLHDDWNISASWRRDYQAKPWWPERISAAFQTYWIYQHLGNLSPADLAKDELWRQVTAAPRSEERRVGKERRCRRVADDERQMRQ